MTKKKQSRRSEARRALLPLGALAAGFGLAHAAWAQQTATPPATAASDPAPVMPQVVVKGEAEPQGKEAYQATTTRIGRGKQELRDVPQSLTVINEKLMDDTNADTLRGALHRAVGISFEAGEGGGIGDLIRLRGFSARGDIYQDGIRDIAQYNRDTFNQDRVEILRGAASMLFGRGSTGGVINQVSKQPFLMSQSEVAFTAGTDDYYRLTGDFNIKTGDDAALRINAMRTDAHSFRNGPETHRTGIAPTFRWGIGTSDEFSVGLYHLEYDDVPDYGFGWVNGRPVERAREHWYGFESDYQKDQATYGTFSWLHRFEGGTEWRTIVRDGHYKRDLWATTARAAVAAGASLDDATPVNFGNQTRAAKDHHQFVQSDVNGRANWFGLAHQFTVGADFSNEDTTTYSYSGTPAKPASTFGRPGPFVRVDDTRTKAPSVDFTSRNVGVYAQDTLQVAPAWKIVAGVRYDASKGEYTNLDSAFPISWDRTDELLSGRLGVLWQPSASSSYYASWGTSYNTTGDLYQFGVSTNPPADWAAANCGGTVDQACRVAYGNYSAQLSANTPPEKSRNFEIGAKWDALDGALSLRTAIFRTEKTNERNTDVDTANQSYLLNGKRHTDGIEIEGAGRVTPDLEVFGGFAYMRGRIDAAAPSVAGTANDTTGLEPGLTPRRTGNLWVAYRIAPQWRLGIGADGMSSRKPAQAETSPNTAPGYVKFDGMVEYVHERYALRLNLFNLFDKNYADGIYRGHTVPGLARAAQLTATATF
ncbi:TonB-dependent receptor [Caldimonas sp. KR1-144]|uniref:TonB-dependent receptor n=1 Tax=Caldimonas sp. KR1-144 TaxID=3400911 RepID=UPI003C0AF992